MFRSQSLCGISSDSQTPEVSREVSGENLDRPQVDVEFDVSGVEDDTELRTMTHPHSEKLQQVFSDVFHLQEFRSNQLATINAAMLGLDVLVLMLTSVGWPWTPSCTTWTRVQMFRHQCRRMQLLRHFGEEFDSAVCNQNDINQKTEHLGGVPVRCSGSRKDETKQFSLGRQTRRLLCPRW